MRTTLTLDDDVAAGLEQLRQVRGDRLRTVVNEVLRAGLGQLRDRPASREPFRTREVDLGTPLFDISNVAEALAFAEGEAFK